MLRTLCVCALLYLLILRLSDFSLLETVAKEGKKINTRTVCEKSCVMQFSSMLGCVCALWPTCEAKK